MNKKNVFQVFLFFVLFFFLPFFIPYQPRSKFKFLAAYYSVNLACGVYIIRKASRTISGIQRKTGDIAEKINLLIEDNSQETKNQASLKAKIRRYVSLEKIIEELNSSLSSEAVCEKLVQTAFSAIAASPSTCVLYLVDNQTNSLALYKTRKDNKSEVIKAKQGDIFDYWVLRHSSPLLIEDSAKDFRFDLDKVKSEDFRKVSSLISSPLISGRKLLGVLRLDNASANAYSQEDLRFLATVCDLGAVALENSILYQNTQEMAIRDGLTGLFTKGHFLELLKVDIKSAIRHNRPVSLLMMDIDFFKKYNDKFGHIAGDIVLKALSARIEEVIKDRQGECCRFGGEEFCAVLPGQDRVKAMETAEEIRKIISELKIVLRRQQARVTVSIGVAELSKSISDEIELLKSADKALYAAKASGRNCVVAAN